VAGSGNSVAGSERSFSTVFGSFTIIHVFGPYRAVQKLCSGFDFDTPLASCAAWAKDDKLLGRAKDQTRAGPTSSLTPLMLVSLHLQPIEAHPAGYFVRNDILLVEEGRNIHNRRPGIRVRQIGCGLQSDILR